MIKKSRRKREHSITKFNLNKIQTFILKNIKLKIRFAKAGLSLLLSNEFVTLLLYFCSTLNQIKVSFNFETKGIKQTHGSCRGYLRLLKAKYPDLTKSKKI